jgi:hypothetical protein
MKCEAVLVVAAGVLAAASAGTASNGDAMNAAKTSSIVYKHDDAVIRVMMGARGIEPRTSRV